MGQEDKTSPESSPRRYYRNSQVAPVDNPTLKELLISTIQRSSIRGLPRVVSSKCLRLRIMWGIAITTLLSIVVFHFTTLVMVYMTGETRIEKGVAKSETVAFPSMTVCSANPLSKESVQKVVKYKDMPFIYTPLFYRNHIKNMIKKSNLTTFEEHFSEVLLLNNIGYYENMPSDLRQMIDSSKDTLILKKLCYVFHKDKNSDLVLKDPCIIKPVSVMGHFNCYELKSPIERDVIELHFTAYLESFEDLGCWHCIPESMETYRSGLLLSIHRPEEHLLHMEKSILLSPGTRNKITIQKSRDKYFCKTEVPKELKYTFMNMEFKDTYSLENCRLIRAQKDLSENCNCGLSSFVQNGTINSCLLQDFSKSALNLTYIKCIGENRLHQAISGPLKRIFITKPTKKCPSECHFDVYSMSFVSEALTDTISKLNLYEYLSHELQVIEKDEAIERIIRLRNSNDEESILRARDLMQNESHPIDRVISISVYHSLPAYVQINEEVLIMDMASLLGQLGGALSMWAGVTVVCIVEMFEFFFHFVPLIIRSIRRRE